jgi:hypothetical protein
MKRLASPEGERGSPMRSIDADGDGAVALLTENAQDGVQGDSLISTTVQNRQEFSKRVSVGKWVSLRDVHNRKSSLWNYSRQIRNKKNHNLLFYNELHILE